MSQQVITESWEIWYNANKLLLINVNIVCAELIVYLFSLSFSLIHTYNQGCNYWQDETVKYLHVLLELIIDN